ncbi:hypothetical protein B0T14DRAFT_501606 [Immersiella caudata]|uniref:Uncharacterized protein n=1 Tax=Immersiella caudata TaxID=314043 RepID=A0AA39XCH8_9PEZI|nr:hypothetical protein B0T14DRAFT_501606 [Immersiella caudata]
MKPQHSLVSRGDVEVLRATNCASRAFVSKGMHVMIDNCGSKPCPALILWNKVLGAA